MPSGTRAQMERMVEAHWGTTGGGGEPEIWCYPPLDRDSVERQMRRDGGFVGREQSGGCHCLDAFLALWASRQPVPACPSLSQPVPRPTWVCPMTARERQPRRQSRAVGRHRTLGGWYPVVGFGRSLLYRMGRP
jgi:hypothetical protein